MSLPQELKYSENLKPIAVRGSQSSNVFLPTTSGTYTSTNNIIRFNVNSSKFLDWRNCVMKFKLKNVGNTTGSTSSFLDGSASSVIQRLSLYGPSQQLLTYIDNYGRLHSMLSDLQTNSSTREGIKAVLEGFQQKCGFIRLTRTANAGQYTVQYIDDQGVAYEVSGADNFRTVAGSTTVCKIGDWTFTNVGAGTATIRYRNEVVTLAASATVSVGNISITVDTGANNYELTVNGNVLNTAGDTATFDAYPCKDHSSAIGVPYKQNTQVEYEIPLINALSMLRTYVPHFLLGGAGITLELLLASDRQVFVPALSTGSGATTAGVYEVSDVSLVIPSIEMESSVNNAMIEMINKVGTMSLSTVGFNNQVYPIANATSSISIPLSFKNKSIKALYVISQSAEGAQVRLVSGRNALNITKFQLRSGSMYYPLTPSNSQKLAFVESLRAFGRLNDLKVGSIISPYNFTRNGALAGTSSTGGCYVMGVDVEVAPNSWIESGLNNASTSEQLYLDIDAGANEILAGNVQIFVQYDEVLTLTASRDVIPTF